MSQIIKSKANSRIAKESDVLFQQLGNRWYIFTEQDGQLIYSVMPEGMDPRETKLELYEIIEEHMNNVSKRTKLTDVEL